MSAIVRGAQLARMLNAWQVAVGVRGPAGRRPEYVVLATAVRGLLIDGRLALGVRLPAERELAAALGISRTTVTAVTLFPPALTTVRAFPFFTSTSEFPPRSKT